MIASISGKLEYYGEDHAVIDVGGIGLQVFLPASTLSALGRPGSQVKLHTHLHLREDNVSLYGFATPQELSLFATLLEVSGIGPRLALGMISAMNPDHLATAIATGNEALLQTIPGIGKKTASRLVLDLKDRIAAGWTGPAASPARENADVLAALASLGYSPAEAVKAVASLPASPKMALEEKVRLALQYFAGK
ncbi:MAG: Holliday junction branch migration protein RuvA [Chloroflexi bacterium]|nr:Holliday junction branch migration protein RuvA [Chloroflexota bacterium]